MLAHAQVLLVHSLGQVGVRLAEFACLLAHAHSVLLIHSLVLQVGVRMAEFACSPACLLACSCSSISLMRTRFLPFAHLYRFTRAHFCFLFLHDSRLSLIKRIRDALDSLWDKSIECESSVNDSMHDALDPL